MIFPTNSIIGIEVTATGGRLLLRDGDNLIEFQLRTPKRINKKEKIKQFPRGISEELKKKETKAKMI